MKQANAIILQLRKWSHLQPNPTPSFFSGRCCKTTCRPTNQQRSESYLTIKRNFNVLLRHQNLPAVSAAVLLPPQSPTLKTAHGFRTAGIRPPIMGSLDSSSDSGIVTVDVKTADNLLHSGYAFLDVRTVEEFKEGHMATERIVNIPYLLNSPNGRVKNAQFLAEVSAVFKKDDRLVVGCRSGVRSLLAIEELQNDGYKHLKDLGGGHLAWLDNALPVANPIEKLTNDPKVIEDRKTNEL
ncbi:uncharacterized protein LOC101221593 isoform X1 [Cucumis sativus]|uniref:Rhodanese domain-containing protein n=1 Tax=Cucumis sativus TaxID=3659 RepID=A0A0A0KJE7_CUCSA|nr:uncharacterized protein LOC101221593 isoform X1 [Cucumis sativus]